MSIFFNSTNTVLKEVIPIYNHGDFLMIDGQTPNAIKHDDIVISRIGDGIKSSDGFVSE